MTDESSVSSMMSMLVAIIVVVAAGIILLIYMSPAFKKNVDITVSYIYLKLVDLFLGG